MTERELETAFDHLLLFMEAFRSELIAMARGRYAEGVLRYPDGPLYRKTGPELDAETAQEIADALVYMRRKLDLR